MNKDIKIIKENLAQNLNSDEAVKSYLKKDKYSKLDLLKIIYRPFKDNLKIKLSLLVYPFVNGIIPVIQAFIMYFLVDMIEKNTDLRTMLFIILAYTLTVFVCSMISNQIELKTYATYLGFRLDKFVDVAGATMEMDYGLGENQAFMAEFSRGFQPFSNNSEGLEGIYHDMYPLLSSIFSFIIISVILSRLSPLILIFAIISVGIQLLIKSYINSHKHKVRGELVKVRRKTSRYYDEAADFSSAKDIRLFSFKDKFIKGFRPLLKDVVKMSRKFVRPEILLSPVLSLLIVGIEAIVYYFLTGRILSDAISLKGLTLMITSITVFTGVIDKFIVNLAATRENLLYVEDGIHSLRADLKSTCGKKNIEGPISISFENVSFSYPLSNVNVLENLSFDIKEGEKIAIVGVNGAGKSTIVSLILGLYKPTKGVIYISGINAEEYDLKSRFKAFATVLQDVEPLAVTIAENVAASFDKIDRDEVKRALDEAGLSYKIKDLPKGIDTPMTKNIEDDGTLFSGGENQKLAIARALYKDEAGCLIMDEPTAALDALAEEKIYKQISEISDEKTLVFISHRLASTRFCDRIMVLDGGSIKEMGTHEELLERGGLYHDMYRTQEKYYKEESNEKES